MVKGVMIGGFALVAAPAEYGVTGIKTFMVGADGVVYEKDLGPDSLGAFRAMENIIPTRRGGPCRGSRNCESERDLYTVQILCEDLLLAARNSSV